MRHCRLALSLSCILLAVTGRAMADGVIRDSVSATSSGRAGTNIAHSDNGAVLLSNPAGIINAPGRGLFEASIDTLYTELDYEDPQNSEEAHNSINVLPEAAGFYKARDGRWAAGVGVFVPAGFTAEWEMAAPFPIPGREKYYSLGTLIKVLPGAAVRVTDRLSVGATVGLAFSQIELNGPFFVQSGMLRGAPTLLKLNTDGLAPTWSIGAQYQLSERTTLGLVYSSESRFELEGDAQATIIAPPAPVTSDFDAEVDIVWPRSIGAGVTHWINCQHRVSVDVLWFDWSDAFDKLDLTLSNPSFAPLAPLTPLQDSFPLEWADSVSLRLGHEYFVTCRDVLRFGYVYNSETIPNSTLTPYIPALLEHTFTVGYGHSWDEWRLDMAYQFAFGPEQDVADSALVGGDFDRSRAEAQAHWFYLGLIRRF